MGGVFGLDAVANPFLSAAQTSFPLKGAGLRMRYG